MNYQPQDFLPIFVQLAAALAFIVATMLATHALGPKRHSKKKDDAFECGIESIGDARTPISVKYFLVAILFVLFDIEIVFMYPWAVNFKQLSWNGFYEMLVFMGLLLVGFLYVLKKGILKWEK
ncbi:NADH-quinone oxidoreductase subunit A [Aquirufa sp. KTFRIE-69F]|jgi:NADH-quinone oxidoreductase subunit A|uniref:NADH-quinone oxidoreductase subunit A n=2 Tax=Aquirufa TaxID=2676247 RepID=A0ABW6DAA8_9BACT|nr:NADH-quinone oxidoreductase subunit A [Aquirufa lenticrescens]UAJ13472.1 NADH-quinone oxidoreductase subunit A [Aquirufa lenticrescens]